MFMSTAFVALVGMKYRSYALALSGLILSAVAPFLTHSPSPDQVSLFCYLLVIVSGSLWISFLREEQRLILPAVVISSIYSLAAFSSARQEVMIFFAYALIGMFLAATAVRVVKSKCLEIYSEILAVIGVGFLLFSWNKFYFDPEFLSLASTAWAFIFALVAYLVFRENRRLDSFYTYAGVSFALIGAATAYAFKDSRALTIAYTIESILAVAVSYLATRDLESVKKVSLLLVIPAFLSLAAISEGDFFTLAVVCIGLLLLGLFFLRQQQPSWRIADEHCILEQKKII